ncbi:MAG TPA: TIGR02206 family membrane protein [Bryobacteraceae bacterium]|nr:TIGR02206 family membrane protein [Bryobacteraceae bacterium]
MTPDLYAPLWSNETVRFLSEHAGVTIIALYLVWSRLRRPRRGSWWRAYLVLKAYAAAMFAFNLHFGTNYFYLMRKPEVHTLLDIFGPWPYYLLVLNAAAFVAFWLMCLPFRRPGAPACRPAEEPEDTALRR